MSAAKAPLPPKRVIAVVDDEPDIGFAVKSFVAAKPLLHYLGKQLPDLLVLDLMLPDGDGLEICKSLKMEARTKALPILIPAPTTTWSSPFRRPSSWPG